MELETERLLLRPWSIEDANTLLQLGSDARVGPAAGWPVLHNIDDSKKMIEYIFSCWGFFALERKNTNELIGSVGILVGKASNFNIADDEGEILYWLGVPYWHQGYATEAVKKIIQYGFSCLELNQIWCGYFEGNDASKKLQENCGFQYQYTIPNKVQTLANEWHIQHVTCLKR